MVTRVALVAVLAFASVAVVDSAAPATAEAATKPAACVGKGPYIYFKKPEPGTMLVYNCSSTTKRYKLWMSWAGGILTPYDYCFSLGGYQTRYHWGTSMTGVPVGIQGC